MELLRREIEAEFFPNGVNTEQIRLLDRLEQVLAKAYKEGFEASRLYVNQEWSNDACLGYVILGSRMLGYTEKQIADIIRATDRQLDFKTIDEARVTYKSSPY